MRHFAASAKTQHEVLLRQRNGRGPDDAKGAEVGHSGDTGTLHIVRQTARTGLLHELVVSGHQFDQRGLFHLTQCGHHDAVIDFHGEADVDGQRMHDAISYQTSGKGGVFSERQGEGANDVERRAGFGIGLFAMRQHGIQHDGTAHGGKRTRPTAAHGICYRDAHGRGRRHAVLLQRTQEGLEIFDRHTTARTRAGHAREVGGVQPQLQHAGTHARRDVAGPGGSGRHRQTANHGLDGGLARGDDVVVADLEVQVFHFLGA